MLFFWRWKAYPMSRSHPPPPQGIYCLQETKSTHTDILKLSHSHIYLSGSPDDSHAGVGFAIPTPLPDCRCRFAMQLSLLCSLFLYYSGHFISWCSTHSTHRCEISRFLHHSYLIVHSRRQLSLFFLRLQDTRSILSTSSYFSETQAPGLHPNCPIHPSPRSESQIYSPAQITKINSFHYKALCQMFQIKSPYYHWVLSPTDFPCSNEFLLALAYPVLPSCIPSSMRISDSRIKYLGHILRHPDSAESIIMFNPSHSLRTIPSPFRRGAPQAHWPEPALAKAAHRAIMFHNFSPNSLTPSTNISPS